MKTASVTSVCLAVLLALVGGGCGNGDSPQPAAKVHHADLGGSDVAVVGTEHISAEQVAQLASRRHLRPDEALDLLLFDAVLAAEARSRRLDRTERFLVEERAVLSSVLMRQIKAKHYRGPVTDQEVEEFTEKHWLSMNRPEARRTAHVLVSASDPKDPKQDAAARKVAHRLAEVLQGVRDPDAFVKRAEQFGKDLGRSDLKIIAQKLPPVVEDGRVADVDDPPPPGTKPMTFDPKFVAAVFALEHPGQQTGVVHSKFGYHVILYTQKIPPLIRSPQERRRMLTEEIRTTRAHEALSKLLERLRAHTHIEVSPRNKRLFEGTQFHFSDEAK